MSACLIQLYLLNTLVLVICFNILQGNGGLTFLFLGILLNFLQLVFDHFSKLFMLTFMLIAIFSFIFFGENTIIPLGGTNMGYFLQANVTNYMIKST